MIVWMVGLISRGMCLLDLILRRARFRRVALDFDCLDITNGLLDYGETPVSVGRVATDRGHHWCHWISMRPFGRAVSHDQW